MSACLLLVDKYNGEVGHCWLMNLPFTPPTLYVVDWGKREWAHPSESNCQFFAYMCVYISVVRHSVNVVSYSFKTIHMPCASTYGQNIEKNTYTPSSYKCYTRTVGYTSEFYFRSLSLLVSNMNIQSSSRRALNSPQEQEDWRSWQLCRKAHAPYQMQ